MEPLTSAQRTDWNDFVTHVQNHGGDLSTYKKTNPSSTLTPDHIPQITEEIENLKAGKPIASMSPQQAAYIHSGLSSKYREDPDNLKYPVSPTHGTNLEAHIDESGIAPAGIPRPTTEDPAARQKYRNQLYHKYGEYAKDIADLPENLDYQIADSSGSLKDLTVNAAKSVGVRPELLFSSAMQEGMRGLIPDKNNKGQTDYSGNKNFPISGFVNFGLDRFSEMYPELAKKGYLPKGFEANFQKSPEKNEKGEAVMSANFKTTDAALQAKAAVLKNTYDHLDNIAKKTNVTLSDKARDFFALVAFNSGESNAQKMLASYKAKGYLKDDNFLKKRPDESWKQVYDNVQKRLKGAELLKGEKYF